MTLEAETDSEVVESTTGSAALLARIPINIYRIDFAVFGEVVNYVRLLPTIMCDCINI